MEILSRPNLKKFALMNFSKVHTVANPTTSALVGMARSENNGTIICIQNGANGLISVNGSRWDNIAQPITSGLNSILWGNGMFVAIGQTGTNRLMHSSDQWSSWTAKNIGASAWKDGCFAQGKFVIVAFDGTARCATSEDGINWTNRATSDNTVQWRSIAYGNGVFVAISYTKCMTSTDGINWTDRPLSVDSLGDYVVFVNDKFYTLTSFYNPSTFSTVVHVLSSNDGTDWEFSHEIPYGPYSVHLSKEGILSTSGFNQEDIKISFDVGRTFISCGADDYFMHTVSTPNRLYGANAFSVNRSLGYE